MTGNYILDIKVLKVIKKSGGFSSLTLVASALLVNIVKQRSLISCNEEAKSVQWFDSGSKH